MTRKLIRPALAVAVLLLPAAAFAQGTPGFDVEAATRAYLNLLQGPARAQSDAYFEGGYWLPLWSALISIAVYAAMLASGLSARLRGWATIATPGPLDAK